MKKAIGIFLVIVMTLSLMAPSVLAGTPTAEFDDESYAPCDGVVWVSMNFSGIEGVLPADFGMEEEVLISLDFKNLSGNSVAKAKKLPLDYFDFFGDSAYAAFNFTFEGLEEGEYNVDIALSSGGSDYALGSTPLLLVNTPRVWNVEIEDYYSTITPDTQSFYVKTTGSGLFTDYEKVHPVLYDASGDIAAQYSDVKLLSMEDEWTEALYEMHVTKALEVGGSYTLKMEAQSGFEVMLNSMRNVSVTGAPLFVRYERDGDTVKIYTENVEPGEYHVTTFGDSTWQSPITIAADGTAVFSIAGLDDGYFYVHNAAEDTILTFHIQLINSTYFDCNVSWLPQAAIAIDDFEARIECPGENITASDVLYARLNQNGEVIAQLSNIFADDVYSYTNGGYSCELKGSMTSVNSKAFTTGEAQLEVAYANGFVAYGSLLVDDGTEIYCDIEAEDYCNAYLDLYVDDEYVTATYAVGGETPRFILRDTNITEGKIALLCGTEVIEEKDLSQFEKSVRGGYMNSFCGSFDTPLDEDKVYSITVTSTDLAYEWSNFVYRTQKMAHIYSSEFVCRDYGYVGFDGSINIKDVSNITFKADFGDALYDVAATYEAEYTEFNLDFAGVPSGYFFLRAYEDGELIENLSENSCAYNVGATDRIITDGAGWYTMAGKRVYALFGRNLDKVESASVAIYKISPSTRWESILEYVDTVSIPKPYEDDRITLAGECLNALSEGDYEIVYIIDGKAAAARNIKVTTAATKYIESEWSSAANTLSGEVFFGEKVAASRMYVAAYDNNTLVASKMLSVSKNSESKKFTIESDIDLSNCTLKAFVWQSMTPVITPVRGK